MTTWLRIRMLFLIVRYYFARTTYKRVTLVGMFLVSFFFTKHDRKKLKLVASTIHTLAR